MRLAARDIGLDEATRLREQPVFPFAEAEAPLDQAAQRTDVLR